MDCLKFIKNIQKGNIEKLYLFTGKESFMIRETLKILKNKLVPEELKDVNIEVIDGKTADDMKIIKACETLPFLSGKRLLIVKDIVFNKKNNNGFNFDRFCDYLGKIPEHTCLVLIAQEIDKRNKIYKILSSYGEVVEFKPLKGQKLNQWIKNKFKKLGKTCDPEVVDILSASLNDSMEKINSEIEKIVAYSGENENITINNLKSVTELAAQSQIFDLVDAVGEKDASKAISMVNNMVLTGEQPLMILFMIIRQLRLIYLVKLLSRKGKSFKEIQSQVKIHPFVLKKVLSQGKNFSFESLKKALEFCFDIDYSLKQGKIDGKLGLEIIISKYCFNENKSI
ncbi:MAG: polymerase subunit delta [Thermosediminibacterales bacterium]|nr:polymerase subunit delta [Thermosediminibacterales bacterium]MDK2835768.1 polymerase subunit delta [Thermosediminibacterales bacterium]